MFVSNEELLAMSVDDALKQWPQTAHLFRQYGLACVGCTIASFCEIGTVADIYGLPPDQFLDDLRASIAEKEE